LVLYREFLSISDGDLSKWLGDPALVHLHICVSDFGDHQCAGKVAGSTFVSSARLGVGASGFRLSSYHRVAHREPLGLSKGLAKLFKRQQLIQDQFGNFL